jgi:transcription elongation factor Elf1
MGSHALDCPCVDCLSAVAAMVAVLVGKPHAQRQFIVKRALRLSQPTTVVCPQCSGASVIHTGRLSTMTCGTCGGIGRVEVQSG